MEQKLQEQPRNLNIISSDEYFVSGHRACIGCGEALAVRLACKALGPDVIIANATGCMEVVSSQLPTTAWAVPWIHTLFENTAAVASGIESGLKILRKKGKYSDNKTIIAAMGGDGGTADIGLQALSGALERRHKFVYLCFDNEAYMNTGIQRSSSTPYGAATTTTPAGKKSIGQVTWKKDMPAIAVAHRIPYVATATPSFPFDFLQKVNKATQAQGPAYLHILSVCPTGWRCAPDIAVEIGRMAVRSGIFPLYEVENGIYKFTYDLAKLDPVKDYLKLQGRFRHLSDDDISEIQNRVDANIAKLRRNIGSDWL